MYMYKSFSLSILSSQIHVIILSALPPPHFSHRQGWVVREKSYNLVRRLKVQGTPFPPSPSLLTSFPGPGNGVASLPIQSNLSFCQGLVSSFVLCPFFLLFPFFRVFLSLKRFHYKIMKFTTNILENFFFIISLASFRY